MKKLFLSLALVIITTGYAMAATAISLADISFGRHKVVLTVDGRVIPERDITYTYDNTIVSVDLGIITPLREGTTRITASFGGSGASLDYTTHPINIDGQWGFVRSGKTYLIARFQLLFGSFNSGVVQPHQMLRQDHTKWPVGPDGWERGLLRFRIIGNRFLVDDPDGMVIFSIRQDSPSLFFQGDSELFELSRQ